MQLDAEVGERLRGLRRQPCPNGASGSSPPSKSSTRASLGSMSWYSRRSVCIASSRIWPASSTPVGPAPTSANVSHRRRSRVARRGRHLERAEDPGADLQGVGERLHPRARAGRTRRGRSRTAGRRRRPPGRRTARRSAPRAGVRRARSRASTSTRTTSASRHSTLRWCRSADRSGNATCPRTARRWPPGRAAAGTGGASSGRRGPRRRRSRRSPRAANRPPKPPPTITTLRGTAQPSRPSRSSRWSPTRSAFAIAVSDGFTAPMLGKKLVSTT